MDEENDDIQRNQQWNGASENKQREERRTRDNAMQKRDKQRSGRAMRNTSIQAYAQDPSIHRRPLLRMQERRWIGIRGDERGKGESTVPIRNSTHRGYKGIR